ncbi:MAG TPA: hypothetical protein VLD63_15025 [Anaerolineales bacterium]|nr:hypothetical protein [Anaerolineales bacterium]
MKRRALLVVLTALALVLGAVPAFAQTYSFQLPQEVVDVFIQADGTYRVVYAFTFLNDAGADPLDFVDVGVPTDDYDLSSVAATVDGQPVSDISQSPYVKPGVAVGLGARSIAPGRSGTVVVEIGRVGHVLYPADQQDYASAKFSPTWFDSQFVHGSTDLTVTFHLPPGVQPDEPRWHTPEGGWPSQDPATGFDNDGRIVYTWRDTSARGDTQYTFGASFPASYIPSGAIVTAPPFDWTGILAGFLSALGCLAPVGFFVLIFALILWAGRRSKLAYLPPKIAVEGHGLKRGLTAVEAAVLLETGLDKVLTMILFAVVKKGAAKVVQEEPLKVEAVQPRPEDLYTYETAFLDAVVLEDARKRQRELTEMMIELVKSVQAKMKGFGLRETREFYRAIIQKAWQQVQAAQTPEMKSEQFAESLEWMMMDRDFDGQTRRTFGDGPVFLPTWWGAYRPSTIPATHTAAPVSSGMPSGGGRVSLPHLPGSDFAASIARGVQNTAGSLVHNVTEFTAGVTRTTNPPPPPSRSSGFSGGHGCACACACAGCACACAGGGR